MDELNRYYEELRNYPFPSSDIDNDKLSEFYSELAEIDAYYAGKINTILNHPNQTTDIDFSYLKLLRNELNDINVNHLSNDDKVKYKACSDYVSFLEKLPAIITTLQLK